MFVVSGQAERTSALSVIFAKLIGRKISSGRSKLYKQKADKS